MKLMRSKVVALVLAVAMIVSCLAIPVSATTTTKLTTTADAAAWLQTNKLLQGDGNSLMLDQKLTREQMMVVVSRLLGVEASAKVYPTTDMTFKDVPADNWAKGYIAWAEAEGITKGYTADKFGLGETLTPWQTEAFMVRALGYVDTPNSDIDAKAKALGILDNASAALSTTPSILRADMALMMYNAVYAVNADGKVLGEELGVLTPSALSFTAKAATVNNIAVTFNGAVADTSKVTFAVAKDGVAANVSSVAWDTAKTVATVTMVSKLTEGDYVITVGGVTVANATATVTVKDQETGSIVFANDKAILGAANGSQVYAFIKVFDQYGADVTKDASLTFTASKSTATSFDGDTGKITVTGAANAYEADDTITITALDPDSGAFATKACTVVDAAAPDAVTVVKLYDPSDDDAVLDVNSANDFQFALTIKDQYGNTLDPKDADDMAAVKAGLAVSSSKTNVLTVDVNDMTTDTIDDVDYFALPVTVAGDDGVATVRMISDTTGKTTTYNVTVKEAAEADKISLTAPAVVVAGEDNDFLATVTDQFGKAITNAGDLNTGDTQVNISATGLNAAPTAEKFVKVNGKLYLRITLPNNAVKNNDSDNNKETDTMNLVLTTPTNQVIQKSVTVREVAVPAVVAKLQNAKTAIVEGGTSDIEGSTDEEDNNVVIYDQYDRPMDLDSTFYTNYYLRFSVDDDTNLTIADQVAGGTTDIGYITADGDKVTLTGVNKDTEKVTVGIYDYAVNGTVDEAHDTLVKDSEYDFTATVVDSADLSSFGVENVDTVYAPAGGDSDYDVDVDVYGVLSSGAKVALPTSMYSVVSTTDGLTVTAGDKLEADGTNVVWDTDKKVATGSIVVTVGSDDGPVAVSKDVTISKVDPAATTFKLDDGTNVTVDGDDVSITAANANDVNHTLNNVDTGILELLSAITVKDQYGVEISAVPTSIVFSSAVDADDDDSLILTNGPGYDKSLATVNPVANKAKIAGAEEDDTFTMTCIYSNGKSVSLNVTIQ